MSHRFIRVALLTACVLLGCLWNRASAQPPQEWVAKVYSLSELLPGPNHFPVELTLPPVVIDPAAGKSTSQPVVPGMGAVPMMGGAVGARAGGGPGASGYGGAPAMMATGMMGPTPGSPFGVFIHQHRSAMKAADFEDILNAIQKTVDPNSWLRQKGGMGRIVRFQNSIVVYQTPANHQRIEAIFSALKSQRSAKQLRTRVYWLAFSDAASLEYRIGAAVPDRFAQDMQSENCFVSELVSMDGQTVHLASGDQLATVVDVTPTVSARTSASEAELQYVQLGTVLEITTARTSASQCKVRLKGALADASDDDQAANNVNVVVAVASNAQQFASATFEAEVDVELNQATTVQRVSYNGAGTEKDLGQLVLVVQVLDAAH